MRVGVSIDHHDHAAAAVQTSQRAAAVDGLLKALFRQIADEPIPPHILALIERLDAEPPTLAV